MKKTVRNNIVVFGKGGVGKSTLAANLSAYYAARGLKVLHVGCDPKSDSTLILLENMDELNTVMSWISNIDSDREAGAVFNQGRLGIKCIEAGGPEAGIGCGGRGIARVMEYLEKWNILERGEFDVVVFDVLGDVVCGGFAAPLRKGLGNKVVMVIAEDEMSYYAANNIAKAVVRYSVNGVSMAGIVVNERGGGGPKLKAEEFASLLGVGVLGTLPMSETPALARHRGITATEFDPSSAFSAEVATVAEKLLVLEEPEMPLPLPLEQNAFMKFLINPDAPGSLQSLRNGQSQPGVKAETKKKKARKKRVQRGEGKLIDAFSLLLGLRGTKSGPAYDLKDVEDCSGGGLVMEFSGPAVEGAVVSLRPKGSGGEPEISADHFDVFLEEGKISAPYVRLLQNIAHRLGSFRLGELETVYRKCLEPDRTGPGSGHFPGIPEDVPPGERWASFFARRQFARNIGQTLFYDIPVAHVEHIDMECSFATPPIRRDEFIPYNYPWLSPDLERDSSNYDTGSKHYATDVGEMDVIYGAGEKLSSTVSGAIDEIGPRKLLVLNNTCVPVVYGEDVPSLVNSLKSRCPVPLAYEGPENSISVNPYHEFFISLKEDPGFKERETVPRSVNLIGFPERKGLEEITKILNEMGIAVNSVFLPRIDLGVFEDYLAAELTVFYPDDSFAGMYEQIFGDVPVKTVSPPAPYGLVGTREWLEAVAGELSGIQNAGVIIEKYERKSLAMWKPLAEEAEKNVLGFVLSGGDSEILSRPGLAGGIPIKDMIREMGFGTLFLKYIPEETRPGRKPAEKEAGSFSTPGELEKLMVESTARCFYSDFYFDDRLVRAGKEQFSLQYFEMGFAGAARTLGRIVEACSVPFFNSYKEYMR